MHVIMHLTPSAGGTHEAYLRLPEMISVADIKVEGPRAHLEAALLDSGHSSLDLADVLLGEAVGNVLHVQVSL